METNTNGIMKLRGARRVKHYNIIVGKPSTPSIKLEHLTLAEIKKIIDRLDVGMFYRIHNIRSDGEDGALHSYGVIEPVEGEGNNFLTE